MKIDLQIRHLQFAKNLNIGEEGKRAQKHKKKGYVATLGSGQNLLLLGQ